MVPSPSTRLYRLKQKKPHAGVALGLAATEALAMEAAEKPITEVTAIPAASTEHALAMRFRIGDSFLFWNSPVRLPISGGLGGQVMAGNGWRQCCDTCWLRLLSVIPPHQSVARRYHA